MTRRWTEADIQRVTDVGRRLAVPVKSSKYLNQKTVVDGITFDSKKEAQRYHELRLMEKANLIQELTVQPDFALRVFAEVWEVDAPIVGRYVADFSYIAADGEFIVEDVKGMATLPLARWKQKHLRLQYGITVREIR